MQIVEQFVSVYKMQDLLVSRTVTMKYVPLYLLETFCFILSLPLLDNVKVSLVFLWQFQLFALCITVHGELWNMFQLQTDSLVQHGQHRFGLLISQSQTRAILFSYWTTNVAPSFGREFCNYAGSSSSSSSSNSSSCCCCSNNHNNSCSYCCITV